MDIFLLHAMLNLLAMVGPKPHFKEHFPSLGAWKQSELMLFLTDLYSLGMEGVPPHWRRLQIPLIAQISMPNYDLFFHLFFQL